MGLPARPPAPFLSRLHGGIPTGGSLLLLVAFACAAAPWLAPAPPDALDLDARLAPPSRAHPFGTDALGRDLLSRTLHGGRLSLVVGAIATALAAVAGAAAGLAAALGRGRLDALLMRTVDGWTAVPALLVAMLVASRAAGSPLSVALVLAAFSWTEPARVVRAAVAPHRDGGIAAAARAAGAGPARIALRHLLPLASGELRAACLVAFARVVLAESTLSFLGFGVQPPQSSWGTLIAASRIHVNSAPWLLLAPTLALFVTLAAAHRLAEAELGWPGGLTFRPALPLGSDLYLAPDRLRVDGS